MPDARIAALNLFPVKGCAGIALSSGSLLATGIAHEGVRDREWMIVDTAGRFVTQREFPRLALIRSRIEDGRLLLEIPGGPTLTARSHGAARDVVVWRSQVRGF